MITKNHLRLATLLVLIGLTLQPVQTEAAFARTFTSYMPSFLQSWTHTARTQDTILSSLAKPLLIAGGVGLGLYGLYACYTYFITPETTPVTTYRPIKVWRKGQVMTENQPFTVCTANSKKCSCITEEEMVNKIKTWFTDCCLHLKHGTALLETAEASYHQSCPLHKPKLSINYKYAKVADGPSARTLIISSTNPETSQLISDTLQQAALPSKCQILIIKQQD